MNASDEPTFVQSDSNFGSETEPVSAWREGPILPLGDVSLVRRVEGALVIRSSVPVVPGDRISIQLSPFTPTLAAVVIAASRCHQGFEIRCRCIAGVLERNSPVSP
ncbi:MAG: hypothetical protein JJU36_03475 [Phycisphaeraceae bacterium]|nr:hypothetical protein [Phycisphaeraceae bacterium]